MFNQFIILMDISNIARPTDPGRIAARGIDQQLGRLERNVDTIAQQSDSHVNNSSKQYALVEQHEIVNAVRANARSLQVSNQVVGTLLDIKV